MNSSENKKAPMHHLVGYFLERETIRKRRLQANNAAVKRYKARKKAKHERLLEDEKKRSHGSNPSNVKVFYQQEGNEVWQRMMRDGYYVLNDGFTTRVGKNLLKKIEDAAVEKLKNGVVKIGDEDKRYMYMLPRTNTKLVSGVVRHIGNLLKISFEERYGINVFKPSFLYSEAGCNSQRLHLDYEYVIVLV